MRLAISNIAWTDDEDDEVGRVLRSESVDALEIAPSRVFADPADVDPSRAAVVANRFRESGCDVVAFQSLLFTRPDAALFGDGGARSAFVEHLSSIIRLAGAMGARRLVLGSPRNRRLADGMTADDAMSDAVDVFRELGGLAADLDTMLCIEPNPPQYGCDFVTTPNEGARLVEAVDSPGFGLHLDVAGTVLAGVDPVAAIAAHGSRIRHVHVSAPDLAEIEEDAVPHTAISGALHDVGYDGMLSIEMRAGAAGDNAERVRNAVRRVRRLYVID